MSSTRKRTVRVQRCQCTDAGCNEHWNKPQCVNTFEDTMPASSSGESLCIFCKRHKEDAGKPACQCAVAGCPLHPSSACRFKCKEGTTDTVCLGCAGVAHVAAKAAAAAADPEANKKQKKMTPIESVTERCKCTSCSQHRDGEECEFQGHSETGMCSRCTRAFYNGGNSNDWKCLCCPRPSLPQTNPPYCQEHFARYGTSIYLAGTRFTDESIATWLQTGICAKKEGETCIVFHEEDVNVFSAWNCTCPPCACKDCVHRLHRCPVCRDALAYKRLSRFQLSYLVRERFSEESLRFVGLELYEEEPEVEEFSPSCLIASCEDVMWALKQHGLDNSNGYAPRNKGPVFPAGSVEKVHMDAFSLVLDFWNMTYDIHAPFWWKNHHRLLKSPPAYGSLQEILDFRKRHSEDFMAQKIVLREDEW